MKKQLIGIRHVGQKYVDEPVKVVVKPKAPLVQSAVARAFGQNPLREISFVSHYERAKLRWMKPDGKGGLVPR